MREPGRTIRLGVVGHTGYPGLDTALGTLRRLAPGLNLNLRLEQELPRERGDGVLDSPKDLDALLTLGGDGTFLRGARFIDGAQVPILGVNMGRLGFLTCCPAEQLEHSLMRFARGDHSVESRMVLKATVISGDRRERGSWLALNDVVIHKGGFARVVALRVAVEDELIASYAADGVVICTPTGSTAYSLSAGGPVVVPTLDTLLITPVSAHTLAIRPVVVAATSRVTVQAEGAPEELMITVDGQVGASFQAGDTLSVSRAPHSIQVVRFPGSSFFATLREKLGWGGIPERDHSRNADRATR
ncbi:MAG TPA: NAD(+)/NADH kinase [Gemmatimonadaceae bacterium]|nr:NAD(+)/NADH kinase [Gemmatimonadaceae bacterium]